MVKGDRKMSFDGDQWQFKIDKDEDMEYFLEIVFLRQKIYIILTKAFPSAFLKIIK